MTTAGPGPVKAGQMLAISQDRAGGPEVLRVIEADRPVPGPTEIQVRVRAAGVNPTDWKRRAGGNFSPDRLSEQILGFDISGVVTQTGPGVTIFSPGDEVYGMPRFPQAARAYAEFVSAPARHCAPKPTALDHVHAAALPLAGLTAWQALVDTAGLKSGQRVLVHAAAGGVGHLAVQIAKALGAYVIGTARACHHALLRDLGADELIDYTAQDFEAASGVDVVLDPIGDDYGTRYGSRSLPLVRPGGTLVTLRGLDPGFDHERARDANIRAVHMLVEPDHAGMRALTSLVDAGQLRALVWQAFPLDQAGAAHAAGEAGGSLGKVVLAVQG